MATNYYKKTFIALGGLGLLALAVIFAFYDVINPAGPLNTVARRTTSATTPASASNDQIFQELDADLADLETQYNFNQDPDADAIAAPNFGDELNVLSQ
ncbi:MAG: hypothetical protein HY422_01650 [Candidatus Komeilibacteria bacterium]|nr:hypothetical protein [Candidatus Komeilibacteria bacterium]